MITIATIFLQNKAFFVVVVDNIDNKIAFQFLEEFEYNVEMLSLLNVSMVGHS